VLCSVDEAEGKGVPATSRVRQTSPVRSNVDSDAFNRLVRGASRTLLDD
jgi:hypothetical protein